MQHFVPFLNNFVCVYDFESQQLRLLLQLCMYTLLKMEDMNITTKSQSVSATEDVYNGDSGIHHSAITAHHSTIDPYAVSEDTKLTSYCQVISTGSKISLSKRVRLHDEE